MFHDIDSTKDKNWEAYPSLIRSMTIHWHIGKKLTLNYNLHDTKKAGIFQTNLDKIIKTLQFLMCLKFTMTEY